MRATNQTEPPAGLDLDQNTCFLRNEVYSRLAGAGPPSMRQKIRFVVASVMVAGEVRVCPASGLL